jgi:alkylation response protein AidB-like acyl-CoA dehydrogenase
MTVPLPYQAAEALEQALGDPFAEQGVFSFRRQIELDEEEAFPEEMCAFLYRWGLFEYFIPSAYGGKLSNYLEALALLRVISRRDLTVAIALGQIYLGVIHVWLAGNDEQKRDAASLIRQNHWFAFALTERAHGGDILASEVQATKHEVGWRLSGEKWLINNCKRARTLTVFARTDSKGGGRGFSLFLLDKTQIDRSSFTYHPKVKTHGIRGADISGIRFQESLLPVTAPIGQIGAGLENSLLGLMVTRTLCAAFSLGAADSALRTVLAFATQRKLYGETIMAIPSVRQTLATAFIDLLIADCVALAATRGLHVTPEQFSVWSAVVKYLAPTTIEKIFGDLSVVLGARYYLREEHAAGLFQKLLRDNAVVSLFDGSTVVNLSAICAQLPYLLAQWSKAELKPDASLRLRLSIIFTLQQPLPNFAANRLTLFNRGRDDVIQGLPFALEELVRLQDAAEIASDVLERIGLATHKAIEQIRQMEQSVQQLVSSQGRDAVKSPTMFDFAKQYCGLHAAAACLQLWLYNRKMIDEFFAKGEWLALCLERLLDSSPFAQSSSPPDFVDAVVHQTLELYQQDRMFSIAPFQLAHRGGVSPAI